MVDFAHQKGRDAATDRRAHDHAPRGVPGKQTLTEHLPPDPNLDAESMAALQALANVLQNSSVNGADGKTKFFWNNWGPGAPTRYFPALVTIANAIHGELQDGRTLSGSERVAYFDGGVAALQPALDLANAEPGRRAWVEHYITPGLARARARCAEARAEERVRNSFRIGDQVIELPADASPKAQAPLLRLSARRMVTTLAGLDEMAIRLGHDTIEHAAHGMMTGHGAHGGKLGSIVDLQHALQVADALLVLTDEDFRHELAHPEGFFAGVSSMVELVKACVELLGASIAVAGYWMAAVGKLTGNASVVAQGMGFARMTAFQFANVIAAVELVHGCAVLADPHATPQAKEGAAVDVVSSGSWLVRQGAAYAAKHAGTAEASAALGEVATFAGAASIAVVIEYAELRLLAAEYWTLRSSLVAVGTRAVLTQLIDDAALVVKASDALARAGILAQQERDPRELAALKQAEIELAREVGRMVDSLLVRCLATPVQGSIHQSETGEPEMWPGADPAARDVFAPLQALRGTGTTPELARRNATAVLDKVKWCLANAQLLADAESQGKTVQQVQAERAEATKHEGGEAEGDKRE